MNAKDFLILVVIALLPGIIVFLVASKLGNANRLEEKYCHPFVKVDSFFDNNKHFVICTTKDGYEIKEIK